MTSDWPNDDPGSAGDEPSRAAEFAATYAASDSTSTSGAAAAPGDGVRIAAYAVGQVASYLRELLDTDPVVQDMWVSGEVRSLSRSQAGHMYFTLRDADGALACVFFRRENRGVRVEEGEQVLTHGRVSLWAERGDLQLYVDALQPEGVGAQQAEFERLRRRLELEGLFDPSRKRPLPTYPRTIGVVTSPAGAVWHDIQTVLARRWPSALLLLASVQVQGAGAAESIAWGVEALNEVAAEGRAELDVLIVARGGGSAEDLAAFNSEVVARAVYASALPLISAVGHETDVTLIDLVADVRAATPSAAAELVAPDREEEAARLRERRQALGRGLARVSEGAQLELDGTRERLQEALPDVDGARLRVDAIVERASQLAGSRVMVAQLALAGSQARLTTLNPQATLARGYAIIEDASGRVRGSVAQLAPDDLVRLRLHDGSAGARIVELDAGDGSNP
ncbi:MAG: exodeoxyribonuclease VII large subunit [Chloroflexi bacterium]|nr:MAG: exodeoxyribonuclease VII large subunit [Chloroflexota bacterium]